MDPKEAALRLVRLGAVLGDDQLELVEHLIVEPILPEHFDIYTLLSPRTIQLDGARILPADMACVALLSNLTGVNVSGCGFGLDFVRRMKEFPRVESLALSSTAIGDGDLLYLSGNPTIRFLSLESTKVGDDGLAHVGTLTQLEELVLRSTNVTNKGLLHLQNMPNLMTIDVRNTPITETGLAAAIDRLSVLLPDVYMLR